MELNLNYLKIIFDCRTMSSVLIYFKLIYLNLFKYYTMNKLGNGLLCRLYCHGLQNLCFSTCFSFSLECDSTLTLLNSLHPCTFSGSVISPGMSAPSATQAKPVSLPSLLLQIFPRVYTNSNTFGIIRHLSIYLLFSSAD